MTANTPRSAMHMRQDLAEASDSNSSSDNEELVEEITAKGKSDVYGLMAIRVLHLADNPDFKAHKLEYIFGMAHSIFVYTLTLFLQLTITAFLMLAAARIEAEYHEAWVERSGFDLNTATKKMADAVNNNPLSGKEATDIYHECKAQLKVRYEWIYAVMIFIWVCNMLIELKDVTNDISMFWGMPKCKKGSRMFLEDGKTVVSLSPVTRSVLLAMGPGVRCFVAVALLFSGCKVLLYRQSMMLVVLCSMSLLFVVSLDDLMMDALSGAATKKQLEDLSFEFTKRNTRLHAHWIGGMNGLTHAFLCIAFSVLYVYVTQTEVTSFRLGCWNYHYKYPDLLVPATNTESFSDMFSTFFQQASAGHGGLLG
jgi:hypothetical protein